MNKQFNLIVLIVAIVSFTSCNKDSFLNVNDDPNRVTESTVTPYLIFPAAAHSVGRSQYRNLDFLQQWLGYSCQSGGFVPDQTISTYNTNFSYYDNLWDDTYDALFDLQQTKRKGFAVGDSGIGYASAILQAQLFQNLVDMFGDIPYSQAFDNIKYPTPSYDKAKDVYNALQVSLDNAVRYLGKNTASGAFTNVDVINGGDFSKWVKYANTLKLRLLIRQSEIPGFDPTLDISKIVNNGGVLGAGETVAVNIGYTNSKNKQSPFYATYGYDPTGADANSFSRANAYFDTLLENHNDLRIFRFYGTPSAGGNIAGSTLGAPSTNPDDPTSNPDGNHSSKFGPGLLTSAAQDQWIMTSFESMFLLAEAIERKWISGDAKAAYQDAVKESFSWLQVPDALKEANTYLASESVANYDNPPAYFKSKPQFISYQKYIALCGTDPIEAWCDLRRLNMIPDNGYISVNSARISNTLPVSFLYPQVEYTSNPKTPLETSGDAFTKKIFWQQ